MPHFIAAKVSTIAVTAQVKLGQRLTTFPRVSRTVLAPPPIRHMTPRDLFLAKT